LSASSRPPKDRPLNLAAVAPLSMVAVLHAYRSGTDRQCPAATSASAMRSAEPYHARHPAPTDAPILASRWSDAARTRRRRAAPNSLRSRGRLLLGLLRGLEEPAVADPHEVEGVGARPRGRVVALDDVVRYV